MIIHDRVYGKVEITEPVALELVALPEMQRLKKIDQGGYRPLLEKPWVEMGQWDHSRFAHSVGVYLLLKKYNTSLDEQIAGLLHDVSHTVFSHCIDYALDEGSGKYQSYQDNTFAHYVANSNIPAVLTKYHINIDTILNDELFPLKENPLPDLCADRIDYCLREAVVYDEISQSGALELLDNLKAINGRWIFSDIDYAYRFAQLFALLNDKYFASFQAASMFRAVGDCVRYAFEHGVVNRTDFLTNDEVVLEKIETAAARDADLALLWQRMNHKELAKEGKKPGIDPIYLKSRAVDPLFFENDKAVRLSDIDSKWGQFVSQDLQPKKHYVHY